MRKVRFQVVSCSGEDPSGPASLLNEHESTGMGYLTPKNCEYPQEIVIQLEGSCRVTQIQVLSHQSYIATKVELYLSSDNTSYYRLGFLSLKSNKESQYSARELKTVHIDSIAQYIKFKLHQCYINEKNLYSQVGIVGINIFGEVENEIQAEEEIELNSMSHAHQSLPPTPGRSNPLLKSASTPTKPIVSKESEGDLRFDAKTATKIKEIRLAKEKAVADEDYEQAKRLKLLEEELKNIGLKLSRLETAKRDAVANEDYDTAKRIKDEILELEESIGMPLANGTMAPSSRAADNQTRGFPGDRQVPAQATYNPPAVPSISKPKTQDHQRTNRTTTTYEEHDREIPTSNAAAQEEYEEEEPPRGKSAPVQVVESNHDGGINPHFEGLSEYEHLADPDPLPDALLKESADMIQIIGDYMTGCFYSNVWNHRDAAIKKVTIQVQEGEYNHDPEMVLAVLSTMIQSGVSDRISQVALSAVSMCDAMLDYTEQNELDPNSVVDVLNSPLVQLVNKLGEPQAKIRDEVSRILLKLAASHVVGISVVASHLFRRTSKKALPLKSLQGRLGVVKELVDQNGLVPGLTLESVMGFLEENSAFAHQSKEIRDFAKAISIAIYQMVGSEIMPFLKSLRPKQLEEYQAAFDGPQDTAPVEKKKEVPRKSERTQKPTQHVDEHDHETDSNASVEEMTCPFCDRYDASFDNDRLDQHFWAECPMLTQCKMCGQVIEISTLNDHLLTECEQKHNHRECPQCGEAITLKFFEKHKNMKDCEPMPAPENGNRCPLCHDDIGPRKRGWKAHLLQTKCPNNPRKPM